MLKKLLGQEGEGRVEQWLITNKFTILYKNFQTRSGEIDIIASKNDIIAFIEVKTRNTAYFPVANVITLSKQKKIIKAARTFIAKNNLHNKIYRFDVAIVIKECGQWHIDYIKNAFTSHQ